MRSLATAATFFFLACILSADTARGQRQSTRAQPGFQLLRSETVQEELKLTPQQVATFQKLWGERNAEMRKLFLDVRPDGTRGLSPDERDKRRAAMQSSTTEYREKIEELLQPEQAARLNQIVLQDRARFNVITALRSRTVAAALALTDKQVEHLSGLQPPRERLQLPGNGDTRRASDSRGRPAELKPEWKTKALALLTDEQRQKLDELMGSPFDLSQVRRRFGRLAGGNREKIAEIIFKRIDGNADGMVSIEEAAASRSPMRVNFDRFDADSDGQVSLAEFQARFPIGSRQTAAQVFARNDRNRDGKITREEASYLPLQANFARFDVNSDGAVDKEELTKGMAERRTGVPFGALFSQNDKNSDRRVTQSEANDGFWDTYGDVDANKDGAIDREEWAKASYQIAEKAAGQRIIGIAMNEEADGPGILVTRVLDASPAAAAGLKEGDRCLEIDGKKASSVSEFRDAVRDGGKELTLAILRDDEELDVTVTFPAAEALPKTED